SCGSVVNNTLKSPKYSDGFYAGNMNCTYNLSIPDGKEMRLKFQSFDLASDSECRIDHLNITNGITEVGYCADQLTGRDLLVSGKNVVLTFHTDWLLENKTGFEILFFAQEISSKKEKGGNIRINGLFYVLNIFQNSYRSNDGSYFLSVLCPRGWISSFHGGCYKVFSNKLDWIAAKSACEEQGSNLAVLNSEAKLREIPSSASGNLIWIGLHRGTNRAKKFWFWGDTIGVTFTFWKFGQPDHYGGVEDCGHMFMRSRKWNDLPCFRRLPYICEIS
ncbi:unnamed protein product, partial [Porites evermanni]